MCVSHHAEGQKLGRLLRILVTRGSLFLPSCFSLLYLHLSSWSESCEFEIVASSVTTKQITNVEEADK